MIDLVLLYMAAGLKTLWGISHLYPIRSIVSGFGTISVDNQHIITMEWIVEGVALIFIGALVAAVTIVEPGHAVSVVVYLVSAVGLFLLAIVSLYTGFKISFFMFKLCPFIFSISAILILLGGVL